MAKKKAPARKRKPVLATANGDPTGDTERSSSVQDPELPWTGERLVPSVGGDIALEHLHRYAIAAEFSAGRDILDIACGEGYGSHLLALHARSVIGVDIAPKAVRHAGAKYQRPNLSFREGACTAIPLPDASVDMVVTFETIEHIAEHEQFLAEIQRVLRKGGLLVISTPERQNYDATLPSENPYHQRELSGAEFETLLRGGFGNVELLGQRVTHASMVLGCKAGQPQKCGMFTGDYAAVEFSEELPAPTYLLAVCSDAPLPAVSVGSFEFKSEPAPVAAPQWDFYAQLFADQGEGYSETLSARQPLTPGEWQTIRFEHLERLHTDRARRLRIDPVNQPALMELAAIRVTRDADHAVLYDASSPSEWARLECSSNLLAHPAEKSLLLVATDGDPQIYLPPLRDVAGAGCTLEVNLRLETSTGALARRLHHLAAENEAQAALAESWKLRAAELEATEATWRQLHTEARAAHEAGVAERERLLARITEHADAAGQLRSRLLGAEGQLVEMQTELERRLSAHSSEAAELQRRIAERSSEATELDRSLSARSAELAELKRSLSQRSAEIDRNTEHLRKAGSQLARVRADLERRTTEAAELRKAVASAERWQRKWPKRVFHRWRRPGSHSGRIGLLRRIERFIRQRRKDAMGVVLSGQQSPSSSPSPAGAAKKQSDPKIWARESELLSASRLVDSEWYCAMNPEARLRTSDVILHYLRHGATAGCDPNPLFQTLWYLEQNPDVAASGVNPLVHYVELGWREGRSPHPRFNLHNYLQANPDIAAAGIEPLAHYLWTGRKEGRPLGCQVMTSMGFVPSARYSEFGKPFTPQVTVIVPNYNHSRYLRQRLDSIYSQTYRNFRVILMDDCSTDDSRAVLEEYARKFADRTELAFNTVNGGSVFAQWQKGMRLAKSELVWIAESDDYCDRNFLDALVPFFRDEAMLAAYCRTQFVGPEGESLEFTFEGYVGTVSKEKWKSSYVETAHREVRLALGIRNTIPNVSSVLFRHPGSLPLLSDPDWLKMRVCGDWVFYLHLIRGGKIAFSTAAQDYYRYHPSNASRETYKSPRYYCEHETVARTIAQLYRVEFSLFEKQLHFIREHWGYVFKDEPKPSWEIEDYYSLARIREAMAGRLPNILLVGYDFATGGGEVFPIRLAEALSSQGFGITFFDFDGSPSNPEFRSLLPASIPVVAFDRRRVELNRMLEDFGIEIIHSHHANTDFCFAERLRAGEQGPRHVVTLHGMYEAMDSEAFELRFSKLKPTVDHWVYTADKNLDPFPANGFCDAGRFTKIPLGMKRPNLRPVDRSSIGIPSEAFVVCVTSRAMFEKGWLESLQVIDASRRQTGKDIHLVFIGEGPAADYLRQQTLPDYVHLLGFKRNPVDYFAMANLGMLASRYRSESCPLVLIECLMAGRPVVASDIGEIRSMLTAPNGKVAGALIPLDDWQIPIDTLASTISRFVLDEETYREAGSCAEAAAERFAIERIAGKYAEVYTGVLKPERDRRSTDPLSLS